MTSLKIERSRLEEFKLAAAANRRSVSAELRWLIDRRVEEFQRELKDAA